MGEVYSLNGEDNWEDELEDVIQQAYDDGAAIGAAIKITQGDSIKAEHSDFVTGSSIIEYISERAYDEYGEWSEEYLTEVSNNKEKSEEFKKLIVNWLSENAESPGFYRVTNTKEIEEIIPAGCA